MLELIKLITDFFILRDARRKGMLPAKVFLAGIGYAVLLYGVGLPASLLYSNHPEDKPIFIAAMVFLALVTIVGGYYYIRWYRGMKAAQRSAAQAEPS
jgi:hypothetical protein